MRVFRLRGRQFFESSGIALAVARRDPQPPYPLHNHDFMELVLVSAGQGIHTSPQGDIPIDRGSVFVIKGDTVHGYKDTEKLCLVNLIFDLNQLALPLLDLGRSSGFHSLFTVDPVTRFQDLENSMFRLQDQELAELLCLLSELEMELASPDPGSRFLAASSFMRIIHYVSRAYDRQHSSLSGRLPYRIGLALSHIESNLNKDLRIAELAELAGMSVRSLQRLFRAVTGSSPTGYLRKKRVERAQWYLEYSEYSMTEISGILGYSDSNYFARQFHMLMGMSPSRYQASLPGREKAPPGPSPRAQSASKGSGKK